MRISKNILLLSIKYILTSMMCFYFIVACKEKSDNKSTNSSTHDQSNRIVIQFRLKSKQSFAFFYYDSLFRNLKVDFNNQSNNDSIISVSLNSHIPIELYTYKTSLVANPNDTIRLSLNPNNSLNIGLVKSKNILFDSSNIFYNTPVFGLQRGIENMNSQSRWNFFKRELDKAFDQEQNRIKQLLTNSIIDSETYKQFVTASEVTYYKHILNYIDGKSLFVDVSVYEKISSYIPNIDKVLNDSSLFLAKDLTSTIYGLSRLKEIHKNIKPFSIKPQLEYNIIKEEDFGKFKKAFLTNWLEWAIKNHNMTNDTTLKIALSDFSTQYKNTVYAKYIDSLAANKLDDTKTLTDTLITKEGKNITWDKLFNRMENKLVVVDFWTSWCPPCISDLLRYDSIKYLLQNKPVEFVFINIEKSKENWIKFSQDNKTLRDNNYYMFYATSTIAHRLNIKSVPRIVIFKGNKIIAPDYDQSFDPSFVLGIETLLKKQL